MAAKSTIEWTESSWNPVTGCTKISSGCEHCYAEQMARRLKSMGQHNYRNGFEVTCHEHVLSIPAQWKTPKMIFVNSMSDLFHEKVPDSFISRIFDVMTRVDRHVYQVLTKRSVRMLDMDSKLEWCPNIWVGVTVESSEHLHRIDDLRKTSAAVKFISFEPLLDEIRDVDLSGIDWVIVGGESGSGARPMDPKWARKLRDSCLETNIPFFFKQWGGVRKKKAGRELDGRFWNMMPSVKSFGLSRSSNG